MVERDKEEVEKEGVIKAMRAQDEGGVKRDKSVCLLFSWVVLYGSKLY